MVNALQDSAQYVTDSQLQSRIRLHAKYGSDSAFWRLTRQIQLPEHGKVVEIGCGNAHFWQETYLQFPSNLVITLSDISVNMVEQASKVVKGLRDWARVDGLVADACALPFQTHEFDVVLARHVLFHVKDIDMAIKEIRRVLRIGGKAIITTNGLANLRELYSIAHDVFGHPAVDQGALQFSIQFATTSLARYFENVEVRVARDVLDITDPEDVIAYLRSLRPAGLSEQKTTELRNATRSAFDANGGVLKTLRESAYLFAH